MRSLVVTFGLALAFSAVAGDLDAVITAHPKLAKFAAALKESGVAELLKKPGPFTVLAVTDDGFARMGDAGMKALKKSPADFKKVFAFHVVKGKRTTSDWLKTKGTSEATLADEKVAIKIDGKHVIVWDGVSTANVLFKDLAADNGVVQIIDTVLLPPAPKM